MHLCVRDIHYASFYDFDIWFRNCSDSVVFFVFHVFHSIFQRTNILMGSSWLWSSGSWIYNYLYNQWLSPLLFWVRIWIRARCTTLCDKVCQWLAAGRRFSPCTLVSSTNKTDSNAITEILLKVALNSIQPNRKHFLKPTDGC